MPKNTIYGKSYDLKELIKLVQIGALSSNHNGALLGALTDYANLRNRMGNLEEENKRLQEILNESMSKKYRKDKAKEDV